MDAAVRDVFVAAGFDDGFGGFEQTTMAAAFIVDPEFAGFVELFDYGFLEMIDVVLVGFESCFVQMNGRNQRGAECGDDTKRQNTHYAGIRPHPSNIATTRL